MTDWKTTAILLASGQGILLSLALLSPFRKQDKSNFFLGLILWVVSLELLSAWAMRAHYFNAPGAFHFYVLGSYLLWPPSVWLFAQLNTHPAFKLRKKHLLLFVPARVGITGILRVAAGHFLQATKKPFSPAFSRLSVETLWPFYFSVAH
jgi:hypothetical protein